jgi:hypothetical protein
MAITPGLQLPYGIQPTNPIPVDSLSGPFTGGSTAAAVASANAAISPALRFQSMEVRLIVGGLSYKYWYYDGTGDANLVEMQTAAVAGGISGDYVQSLNGKTGTVVLGSDTQIIYNSSGDLTGSANMVYNGLTFGLTADMKIVGNLIVTGRIITSTGIQGDPDADIETIEDMLLDGGEFS